MLYCLPDEQPMLNIADIIRQETQAWRDKTAVVQGDRSWTYAQLLAAADAVAEDLRRQGVRPTQRVVILGQDSADSIVAHLAVLSLAAVAIPVSSSFTRPEIEAVRRAMRADFVLWQDSLSVFGPAEPVAPGAFFLSGWRLACTTDDSAGPLPSAYAAMNPAFIRFSSGTTGVSKGVLLSHESVVARTDAANRALAIGPEDHVLWVLSMSYHFVVSILLFLRKAATIVLCHDNFPLSLLDGLRQRRSVVLYASPFHYQAMASSGSFVREDMAQVRLALSTAIHLPRPVAEAFADKFGFPPAPAYGIIEAGLPFVNLSGSMDKIASVGPALPDFELAIRDPDADGVGKIMLKGPGMFDAYLSPWQTRDQCLADGWFRTGDLGRLDEDGCLYIVGRENSVINFAGMKVFPQEVEEVLDRHPAIAESLVYGEPHPEYGRLPCAKIVLDPQAPADVDLEDIRRHCYRSLASFKTPKKFEIVDGLEKTASNKIRRPTNGS